MSQTLIVFGNCQAKDIAHSICHTQGLRHLEMVYIRSYDTSDEEIVRSISYDQLKSCKFFFEQVTPNVRMPPIYDFSGARRVTFGSLDLNILWPLHVLEKRMRPEPPEFPWGRYAYGDRVINEIIDLNLKDDAAWDYYRKRSDALLKNLGRLNEIEVSRWRSFERHLDVQMSEVIFPMLSERRMFTTYNHPNREILCRLGGRILVAADLAPTHQTGFDLMQEVLTWEAGENYHQPVHPKVAEALDLKWWSPDMLYRRFNDEMTYEEFIRGQIAWE